MGVASVSPVCAEAMTKTMLLRLLLGLVAAQLGCKAAKARGFLSTYNNVVGDQPCDCNCCTAQPRRPTELTEANGGRAAGSKCALPTPRSHRFARYGCSQRCSLINDRVLGISRAVETNRFCFYHCEPKAGKNGTQLARVVLQVQPQPDEAGHRRRARDSADFERMHDPEASTKPPPRPQDEVLGEVGCVALSAERLDRAVAWDRNGRDAAAL